MLDQPLLPSAEDDFSLSVMSPMPQKILDAFFAAGGLTVYATSPSAWRWRACAGGQSLEAVVIDPHSVIENAAAETARSTEPKQEAPRKPFEHHTLVRWLSRAVVPQNLTPSRAEFWPFTDDDAKTFAGLLGMKVDEWQRLGLKPRATTSEIRLFAQGHNAALSDIESAFLPARFELPSVLSSFYIRHLTKARRDAEAALLVAQSCGSLRIPSLMSDAFAVYGFEAAMENPVKHEGNDYSSSTADDTSLYIDAAVQLASQKLALPADHPDYLLRLNLTEVTETACDIVERLRPQPFAFLLKAKELYVARSDVSRFPPEMRFMTALNEGDLPVSEAWVQRLIEAYERLFGNKMGMPSHTRTPPSAQIVRLK
jgi:hypothetical protein